MCTGCHTRVHEGGYRIEMGPDGQPVFFDPRGNRIDTVPPRPTPARLGSETIEAENARLGIGPQAGRCRWDGGRVDYGAAVSGLLSTAARPSIDVSPDHDDELADERAASERHAERLKELEREYLDALGTGPGYAFG